jgi:hypothetical protein
MNAATLSGRCISSGKETDYINGYMRKIRAFLKPEGISFLILVLPYLAFSIPVFAESGFFSLPKFLLTLIIIVLVDVLVKMFLKRYPGATLWMSLLIYSGVLLFLYSPYIILPTKGLIEKHFLTVHVRGRFLVLYLFALIIGLVLITYKKRVVFNYAINMFMLILFALNLFANIPELTGKNKEQAIPPPTATNIHFDTKDSLSNKPIILIITDEYSSPDELYTLFRDSSLYDFSRELTQTGWIVRNRSFSYDTSTIYSLSSLFNFDLSESGYYKSTSLFTAASHLMHCTLGDSLERKNIGVINFGIFDFNRSPPLTRLYPYPKNYLEALLYNSLLTVVKQNTGSMNPAGFGEDFSADPVHNKKILETLPDSLQRLTGNDYFIYAHLLMPHLPYDYFNEFRSGRGTAGYLAFWKFTNKKVLPFVKSLQRADRYRIILTGDHGYRDDSRIRSSYTATAFYGFDEKDVEKIKAVQDLGALINAYFK